MSHLATFKPDCVSIQFWNPHLVANALNCKLETRRDLLQKVQRSKKSTGDEHMIQKETLFAKAFHAGCWLDGSH